MDIKRFRYDGERNLDLSEVKTGASNDEKKMREELTIETSENILKISELQEKLYADGKEGLIIVLQARDAAGKDSIIKHIMTGVNPAGVNVHSFKAPSKEELNHDFLWRFNKALPERGKISIFNRSHYEDVLVVKVHHLEKDYKIPERCKTDKYYEKRYAHIRNFEDELYWNGYRLIKIFLNVSKEKEKERFLERIDLKEKNWKFSTSDLEEREYWDDYTKAYEECIEKTATKDSPWYVVPADNKWYTRYVVSEILYKTMKDMDPHFPVMPEDSEKRLAACKEHLLNE